MKKEALCMHHISYGGGTHKLYSCSLSVLQGEIVGVVGLRNSGISEMFQILSGKAVFQGGYIYLNEKRMRPCAFLHPELLGIASVHYNSVLNKELTVAENIVLMNHRKHKMKLLRVGSMNEQAGELLHSLGIEVPVHRKAGELTLAQQHRILIARAIYEECKIILLENIWQQYSKREMDMLGWLIRRTAKRGISYIAQYYHDSYMLKYMDKLTFLRGGVTVGEFEQKYFADIGNVRDMLGQPKENVSGKAGIISGEEILRVENFCTDTNHIPVNFSVCVGETVILLDEEQGRGAELTNILSGKDTSSYISGKIYMDQKEIRIAITQDIMKRRGAFLPEHASRTGLYEEMTIGDNILLTKLAAGWKGFWYLRKRISRYMAREFLSTLPEESKSKYNSYTKVRELDEKERYELLLYKNLRNHPRIFIMQNPLAYNDEATISLITRKILELNHRGIGVLIDAHDISSVPKIPCRILKLPPQL